VLSLAAQSLERASKDYILDINDMDFAGGLLDGLDIDENSRKKLTGLMASKNPHGAAALAKELGASDADIAAVAELAELYGSFAEIEVRAKALVRNEKMSSSLKRLNKLSKALGALGTKDRVKFDFSIVNNADYYNGVIFKGYIKGLSRSVLAGGQYDNLMRRFSRRSDAIGFALYLNDLAQLSKAEDEYSCDVVVEYGDTADEAALAAAVKDFADRGLRVRAEREPDGLRCKKMYRMAGESLEEVNDA